MYNQTTIVVKSNHGSRLDIRRLHWSDSVSIHGSTYSTVRICAQLKYIFRFLYLGHHRILIVLLLQDTQQPLSICICIYVCVPAFFGVYLLFYFTLGRIKNVWQTKGEGQGKGWGFLLVFYRSLNLNVVGFIPSPI